ncbi:MAG: hypothetical protein OD811_01880 [Alphaproteobacteria bacterium]
MSIENFSWITNDPIGVITLPVFVWMIYWYLTNRKNLNSIMEGWEPLKDRLSRLEVSLEPIIREWAPLKETVTRLEVTVTKLEKSVDSMLGEREPLKDRVSRIEGAMGVSTPKDKFVQSESPMRLSESGLEVSDGIEGEALAIRYKGEVMKKITDDDSAYDIQEKCFEFAKMELLSHLTDEEKARAKDYAFRKGENLYSILWTVGVHMRDLILADRGYEPKQPDADDDSPHPPAG